MEARALPRLPAALADIPGLVRGQLDGESPALGVIAFAVLPDAALYRLLPESLQRLGQVIARQLLAQLRDSDRLYSISNWEWLILLPAMPTTAVLTLAMLKLRRSFDEILLDIDGVDLRLETVCGGATHPDDGDDAMHLVQSARIARLHAERSKQGSLLYDHSMEHGGGELLALDRELQNAFSGENSLELHLQPQVDALSRACVGAEALLRWRRGNGQWVPPPSTLAAIERLGLRNRFNRWLFQRASQTCAKLADAGISLCVSVNLSANDLHDPEVPELLSQALSTWAIPPQLIKLEITETTMVQETEGVMDVLNRLRELGVALSIDDFGTGFSGMSYLKSLPVQEVKIDQSFIYNIVESAQDREIADSIIRLAHRLGMEVTAEGVETRAAAELISTMGCDRLQGFLFSHALPLNEFIDWHRQFSAARQPGASEA